MSEDVAKGIAIGALAMGLVLSVIMVTYTTPKGFADLQYRTLEHRLDLCQIELRLHREIRDE